MDPEVPLRGDLVVPVTSTRRGQYLVGSADA